MAFIQSLITAFSLIFSLWAYAASAAQCWDVAPSNRSPDWQNPSVLTSASIFTHDSIQNQLCLYMLQDGVSGQTMMYGEAWTASVQLQGNAKIDLPTCVAAFENIVLQCLGGAEGEIKLSGNWVLDGQLYTLAWSATDCPNPVPNPIDSSFSCDFESPTIPGFPPQPASAAPNPSTTSVTITITIPYATFTVAGPDQTYTQTSSTTSVTTITASPTPSPGLIIVVETDIVEVITIIGDVEYWTARKAPDTDPRFNLQEIVEDLIQQDQELLQKQFAALKIGAQNSVTDTAESWDFFAFTQDTMVKAKALAQARGQTEGNKAVKAGTLPPEGSKSGGSGGSSGGEKCDPEDENKEGCQDSTP